MEKFKENLQKKVKSFWVISLVLAAAIAGVVSYNAITGKNVPGENQTLSFLAVLLVFSLIHIKQFKNALNDEARLKHMYIKNTDERSNQVIKEASRTSIIIIIIGLALSSLIASYFSQLASNILLGSMTFITFVHLAVYAYYNKKM